MLGFVGFSFTDVCVSILVHIETLREFLQFKTPFYFIKMFNVLDLILFYCKQQEIMGTLSQHVVLINRFVFGVPLNFL